MTNKPTRILSLTSIIIIYFFMIPVEILGVLFSFNIGWSPANFIFEIFITAINASLVISPIAKAIRPDDPNYEKQLVVSRTLVVYLKLLFNPTILIGDFIFTLFAPIILVPIIRSRYQGRTITTGPVNTSNIITNNPTPVDEVLKNEIIENKVVAQLRDFDVMYSYTDDKMLETFIKREIKKSNSTNLNSNLTIPYNMLKRKVILNIIFAILLFVYICLIFFHFPAITYIIGAILLVIFFVKTRKYNVIEYLKKEVKSRPSEKISNIIMNTSESLVKDKSVPILIVSIFIAIIIPMILFMNPVILYEQTNEGYYVRFYAFGIKNYKTAEIPATYKGKKVIGLRGNTFSNMPFLKSVKLPDSIKEIRGQAFKNCTNLVEVNMPEELEYLGGGSFYNCKSLQTIEFYDNVKEIGGEAFVNATSLVSVKLPSELSEIRGDTFTNCTSLRSIDIPDTVTRIGGHAFENCTSLNEVNISSSSKLNEIGSSAFRSCGSLYEITLPHGVSINERAFKNSPTEIKYHE